MTSNADLLIEIGTEELPPKNLKTLSEALTRNFETGLKSASLEFASIEGYATPRRLAVKVSGLSSEQPAQEVERRGPALAAALDAEGEPTKAAQGFMRSCGVESIDDLDRMETEKGTWLVFRQNKAGESLNNLIEPILTQALKDLPIERRMRWGASRFEFVRPIHWLVVLYGTEVLPCSLFGIGSGRTSRGHRFMSEGEFEIASPERLSDVTQRPKSRG